MWWLAGLALAETAIRGSLSLQVSDPAAAQAAVIASARAAGGWFAELGDDRVSLRVPAASARAWLTESEKLGRVVDRSWSATSLDQELVELEARLRSREEVLERYLAVLADAGPDAFVAVQSSISRTIAEIESIQGRIRVLRDQAAFARLDLSFRFVDRAVPVRDGSSSFAWINTVNLADLQAAFRAGRHRHRSAGVGAVAPQDFAAFKRSARFAATSDDDVVYRVRVEKNKPRAELAFWAEALRVRMLQAGYTLLAEGELAAAGGQAGHWLELGAAAGAQDDSYLVGLFVDGRRLILVEAAGESRRFAARREAVLAAVAATSF